jgi:hypothetical protein
MHPLRQEIVWLRRYTRRLMLAYGIACVVFAFLGGALVMGVADYLIRFQDRGVRVIATLTVLGVTAWAVYRYLRPVLLARITDVAIARRIERRFPELADRLSSAIDFLSQREDDPAAGSAELRRTIVMQTAADVENLRWSAVVDARPVMRVGLMALAVIVIVLLFGIVNPGTAMVAVERLAMPWSDVAWPRHHHLAFKNVVRRVAIGQDFEVELIDESGTLPEDARIVYRYTADGQVGEEQSKPVRIGGALVARREKVVRPFEYRATGGDDDTMPWILVGVVEPPAVESIKLTLHPPEYTGWATTDSERRIEALRGTRVALAGRTTKPIVAANLHQENGALVPLQLTHQGRGFALAAPASEDLATAEAKADHLPASWVIDKSGKYWIELRDAENLVGGADDRWDVHAIQDDPPRITIERPVATLYVTSSAVLPLKLDVRDDLAIHKVALHYLRSDQSDAGERVLSLYGGAQQVPPREEHQGRQPAPTGEARVVEHDWDLAPLALSPGVQLTLTATAADYRPQTGVSQNVRVSVLTPAEFDDRISARQAGILAELARILKLQQENRAGVHALLTQATRAGAFRKQDADAAHTSELSQRQIRRSLASASEGVVAQTAALLDELFANRIDNPETIRRVERIQEEVHRLNEAELASVEQELVALVKNAQLALQEPAGTADIMARISASLTTAVGAQDGVIAALERLLDDLAEWNDYRAVAREIAEVQREQRTLQARTETIQPNTLGRDVKELSGQEQADLQNVSHAQAELARRFDKLQETMEEINTVIRESAPLAADSLADAIDLLRREAIGSDMRDSARFAESNRLGQALQRQKSIDAKISELLDILANRREQELSRLVKKLRAAEQKLAALRQEQQGLRKKFRQAHQRIQTASDAGEQEQERQELARLTKEQRKLADEAERFARELARLRAERSSEQTASAAGHMQGGADAGQRGDSGAAAEQADKAKKDLDDAQAELADRRRQAEQDLANEQLATVEHSLVGLAGRQEAALAETRRLQSLRDASGGLRPEQISSLNDLARNEQQLKDEADAIAEKVTAAEVFQLGVRSAAEQMARAAELLRQADSGEATQRAETQALARLRQLLAALKEGQAASGDQAQNAGQNPDNGDQPSNRPSPIVHSVTEIKLLTVMQEDVNRRTIELKGQIGERAATAADQRELSLLVQEQSRIAELAHKLTVRAAQANRPSNPEDDPDTLPDIRTPGQRDEPVRSDDPKK